MKFIVLLIPMVCPLHAELLAHFQTSRGEVVVELQYAKAPQSVANFMTLAEGTRAWVDPATGAVRMEPYYNGTKIHRTSNNSTYKFAQGGSRIGDGSDGPGFTIKDEFDPTLTHNPYVLSMANSGPNSNGSQFFLTGNVSIPSYDGNYSIFGIVNDPTSRTVVDDIISAGPNGTAINNITFTRTDPAAAAFDEQAQNLPIVTQPAGSLNVVRGVSATWNLKQLISTGTILRAFRSTTLAANSWSELSAAAVHVGITAPLLFPTVVSSVLDDASNPSAFYNISIAEHPGSVSPSTLADRTVAIDTGNAILSYAHVTAASGGTATYTPYGGVSSTFLFNSFEFHSTGHAFIFIVENVGMSPRYLMIKVGCDSASNTQISGRHSTSYYDSFYGWQAFASGAAALTR
ncbi:MAG: peptidylprolyl isomerase [Luteolibacter sp.]